MLAELAEQLIRFHLPGSEETILHIVTTLRLAEAGITAKLAAAAPSVDEQAERRRAKDRDRKRMARGMSADNDGVSADNPQNSESKSSPFFPPHPPINPFKTQKQKIATATPLPIGWEPNEETKALAARLRFDGLALSNELARFAAWAASNDQRKADWDSCFCFWLRNGKPKSFKPHVVPAEKSGTEGTDDILTGFDAASALMPEPWRRVCAQLRNDIGGSVYASWFMKMELDRIEDGRAFLSVPSKFIKTWIVSQYLDKVLSAVVGEIPEAREIVIEVRDARKHG